MKIIIIFLILSLGKLDKAFTEVAPSEPKIPSRFKDSELINKVFDVHKNVLKFLELGNSAFLTSIKNCLTKEGAIDTATRSLITADGSYKNIEIICDKLINSYLGENYESQFNEMRLQLALTESELKSDDISYFLINGAFDNLAMFATINIKHPTNNIGFTFQIDPLSQEEQQKLKERLNNFRDETCSSFMLAYLDTTETLDNPCGILNQNKKNRTYRKIYFRQLAKLNSYFDLKFKEFQIDQFKSYVNSVRSNRFLLLLGKNPSKEQIFEQINILVDKSKKRIRKYDNLTFKDFYNTQWAYIYTNLLVKKELALTDIEIIQLDKLVQNILTSEGRWNLASSIGTTVGSIALGLTCFLPQTKYLGILNSGRCARIAFASMDIYFLIDGHMAFISSRNDYLSTIIDTMDISETNIEEMTSEKNMNILSLVLLPFFI